LTPDSSSKIIIKDRLSNHSYLVDVNGAIKHIHADKFRKYNIQVDQVTCDIVTIDYHEERDFGLVQVVETSHYEQPELWPILLSILSAIKQRANSLASISLLDVF